MACEEIPVQKNVKQPVECRCYGAVMRTYKSMSDDEPHLVALAAAHRVYRYHHPEDSKADAFLTVESWIAAAHAEAH